MPIYNFLDIKQGYRKQGGGGQIMITILRAPLDFQSCNGSVKDLNHQENWGQNRFSYIQKPLQKWTEKSKLPIIYTLSNNYIFEQLKHAVEVHSKNIPQ